ncbi:accessory gene regulator B family protein [Desulfosporosinus shakirovi]|uniref:accessory gene regulator B family protein n=1 Tax=Desulfosporosinus shakirovi TaxID=2885154 RepID=UPI001E2B2FC3|nr:accessory gene regulator B family protein [Desulfosporosinus sp. SRJS8]MCB8814762.1 accessory gene regulator B family protein [Desulfosporosinus sp. SRJS8]
MFELERIAHGMTNNLLKDSPMDAVEKAKVEYGLALVLGLGIEFILTVGVSFFLETVVYTIIIMLSALALRISMGGAHCSSFLRCQVFTLVLFIGTSISVKKMVLSLELRVLIIVSLILGIIALIRIWKLNYSGLIVWILFVLLPVMGLSIFNKPHGLMVLALSSSSGIFLQSFMASTIGKVIVKKSDQAMQRLGI